MMQLRAGEVRGLTGQGDLGRPATKRGNQMTFSGKELDDGKGRT